MKKRRCLCFDPREKIEDKENPKENPKEAEKGRFGRFECSFETDDHEFKVNLLVVCFSPELYLLGDRQKWLGLSE